MQQNFNFYGGFFFKFKLYIDDKVDAQDLMKGNEQMKRYEICFCEFQI